MKILMIAYYFPPDSSSGSFRPLFFAKYLHEIGENICILTVREQDYLPDQPKDYKLLENINENFEIVRTGVFRPREGAIKLKNLLFGKKDKIVDRSYVDGKEGNEKFSGRASLFQELKDTITDCLSTPDPNIGWLPLAVRQGVKIINTRKTDVIYATGSPWTSLIIGVILKKMTGKPLVMDFRDPWVANPGFLIRSRFIRFIESVMEKKVVFFADKIITNTHELKQNFLVRFPWLDNKRISAIPNGFESYMENQKHNTEKLTFTHAGSLYFSRNPKWLLQAALNLTQKKKIQKQELRIVFLGGISIADPELEKLLDHPDLKDVTEILPRLPYDDAIKYQAESDVLFLIQPDFPLQVPRKLYEYMAFLKPVLGITNPEGATARIIRENNLGLVASNQTSEIESALENLYERWKKGDLVPLSAKKCDMFMNKNLATDLLNFMRLKIED